jgi:TPR repeat protein
MFKPFIAMTLLFASVAAQASNQMQSSLYQFQMKMAQKGSPKAEFLVGEMNEEGRGTPKNLDDAIAWYQKAAEHGYTEASKRLAGLKK